MLHKHRGSIFMLQAEGKNRKKETSRHQHLIKKEGKFWTTLQDKPESALTMLPEGNKQTKRPFLTHDRKQQLLCGQ